MASLLVLVAPACGLGEKDDLADRIIGSVDLAVARRTVTGTLGVTGQVVKLPAAAAAFAESQGGDAESMLPPPSVEVTYPVQVDLSSARAALLAGDPGSEQPIELWDDLDLYGKRQGIAKNDARPWAKVTLEDLDDGEAEVDPEQDAPIVAVHAVNPALLVDLIAGVLTGSIEEAGAEVLSGVRTTRYDANFDLDKTTYDTRDDSYDDDRRESVEGLFDILKVNGSVNGGSVWIDDEGLPRQFLIRLRTEPAIGFGIEVSLRLSLEEFGAPLQLEPPSPRDWLEVGTVIGFLRTIVPESLALAAFSSQDGSTNPAVPGLTTTTTSTTTSTTSAP